MKEKEQVNLTQYCPAHAYNLAKIGTIEQLIAQPNQAVLVSESHCIQMPEVKTVLSPSENFKFTGPVLINPQPIEFPKTVDTQPIYLTKLSSVVCIPGQVALKDKHVLTHSFLAYINWSNSKIVKNQSNSFELTKPIENLTQLSGNYLFLDHQNLPHTEAFLLNVLSQLWAWQWLHDSFSSPLKILVSNAVSQEQLGVLHDYGIPEDRICIFNSPVECENVIFATPGFVVDGYISEFAWDTWNTISDKYTQNSKYARVYLSRKSTALSEQSRRLVNEDQVENLFKEHGFEIINLNTISFAERVRICAGAEIVAGASGAEMLNLVFQKELKKTLVLTSSKYIKMNDFFISSLHTSDLTIFIGNANTNNVHGDWTVDLNLLETTINEWLTKPVKTVYHSVTKLYDNPSDQTQIQTITNQSSDNSSNNNTNENDILIRGATDDFVIQPIASDKNDKTLKESEQIHPQIEIIDYPKSEQSYVINSNQKDTLNSKLTFDTNKQDISLKSEHKSSVVEDYDKDKNKSNNISHANQIDNLNKDSEPKGFWNKVFKTICGE